MSGLNQEGPSYDGAFYWHPMHQPFAMAGGPSAHMYQQQQPYTAMHPHMQQHHQHVVPGYAPPTAQLRSSRAFQPALPVIHHGPHSTFGHQPYQQPGHHHYAQPYPHAGQHQQQHAFYQQGFAPAAQGYGQFVAPGAPSHLYVDTHAGRAHDNINNVEWNGHGVIGADHDHPSFDKPPHRSAGPSPVATRSSRDSSERSIAANSAVAIAINGEPVEYDLVANVSPVPPPPPMERSAVPLADLATHMVWEACALGVAALDGSVPASACALSMSVELPIFLRDGLDARPREASIGSSPTRGRSHPHTPELYGAIGDGRLRKVSRMSLDDGYVSGDSSPGSSAPGTPGEESLADRRHRLAALGLLNVVQDEEECDARLNYADDPVEFARPVRKEPSRSFPTEPTGAFRQFVKQILTATLVAPEDLILALYFVARIPSASFLPPTPPEPGSNLTAEASAIKAAPFKVLLGALMLANKTLQDNSYRNETFSAVSGIPLRDVNELEIFVYSALKFDTAVEDTVWRSWLDVVVDRSLGSGNLGRRVDVHAALRRLSQASSVTSSPQLAASPVMASSPVFRPMTPPNSSASAIASVNLDASGPLESPIHFDGRKRLAPPPPSPSRWSRVTSNIGRYHELSNARSFSFEHRLPLAVGVSC